jgi:hypothetical protein
LNTRQCRSGATRRHARNRPAVPKVPLGRARSGVLHAAGRPPTRPLPGVDNQSCPVARLAQLWLPSRRTGHPRLLRVVAHCATTRVPI